MCLTSVFRWIVSSGLASALVLAGLNPVAGQAAKSGSSREVRRLSLVIGGNVRIAQGVSVGKIEDVVLNDQGCIDYVVVVYQDKYVPIPWSVATVDYGQRIVTVDITEQRFAEVPTFTRTEFAVLATTEFTQKVRSAFRGKGESASAKADAKAESPKAAKSDAKPEPAKAGAKEEPKAEAKEQPKEKPLDKPKGEASKPKAEPKEQPKEKPLDKPKGEASKPKAESKDKPKEEPLDKPKGEPKNKLKP